MAGSGTQEKLACSDKANLVISICSVMFCPIQTSKTCPRVFSSDMQVRLLYFGVLKDAFGSESELLELAGGSSVADLMTVYRRRDAGRAGLWDSIAVAVNQEYARPDAVLRDADEVALLPPVSGGCAGLGTV